MRKEIGCKKETETT